MVVSASPYEHMIGKPNVKYVANMHGELELLLNAIFNIFFVCKYLLFCQTHIEISLQ